MEHLKAGGIFYALWRGIKYYIFLRKEGNNIIKKGRLTLICERRGIKIFWDNYEITSGAGLNSGINTLGIWTDSSRADWHIEEKGADYFRIKIRFKKLPLCQIWSLRVCDSYEIYWEVETDIEQWVPIDEFRILTIVHPRYKCWLHNHRYVDFPCLNNTWVDLCMDTHPTSLVGVQFFTGEEFLPSLIIEPQNNQKDFLSVVQNMPLDSNAHIVGVKKSIPEEKKDFLPGRHHFFSGVVTIYETNAPLDEKIENLRQQYVEKRLTEEQKRISSRYKTKALLVNLPWQKKGMTGVRAGSRWPHIKDVSEGNYFPFPFFLAYATALLRKNDIQADVIDAITQQMSEDDFLEELSCRDFDILVAETSVPSFYYDMELLKKLSSQGATIVLCGPHYETYSPSFLEQNRFIEYILFGEYEFTLLALMKALSEGQKDFSSIQGLIWRDSQNQGVKNMPRPPFDINLLPWPHREGLPMDKYWDLPGDIPFPSVQMLASRGCPFSCNFCLWPQVLFNGNTYRARTVKDCIDEMEFLVVKMKFNSVYFDDDTFNVGKPRMLQFCNEIIKRELHTTPWAIMAKPDLMDEEILETMREAGLEAIKYGVESVAQKLVTDCGKPLDLKKVTRIIKYTKYLGIKAHLTFSFGLPGETQQTIKETIDFALEMEPESVQFSIVTPFPGTKLFDQLDKENRILTKDWSLYDGHYNCVYQPHNLAPSDLAEAKAHAYRVWKDYQRKKKESF